MNDEKHKNPNERKGEKLSGQEQHEVLQDMLRFHDIREDRPLTDDERKEFYKHFMESLRDVDGDYSENVNDIYYRVKDRVIVRREHPKKVMNTVLNGDDIEVFYSEAGEDEEARGDMEYRNATYWEGVGDKSLENPFMEGFSHEEGIVTVIGFDKGKDIREVEIEGVQEARGDALNFDKDISIEGKLHRDDLKFLVARIPADFVDEIELTESEREKIEEEGAKYIFRGVYLDTENEKEGAPYEAPS